jgi:pimeloyl-ACP methyl ester carboxylesterase
VSRLDELARLQRGYVSTSTGQIHYATIGSGQPLLLLHQSAQSWKIYARLAHLLATRYRVVAIDLPGFGESAPLPDPFEVSDIVRVVIEVLDGLDLGAVLVNGHHTGATVTCELAASHPERVRAIAPSGFLYRTRQEREAALADLERRKDQPLAPRFTLKADGSHLWRVFERMSLRRWQGKVSAAGFEHLPSVVLPFDQPQERPEYALDDTDVVLVNESMIDNLRAAPYGALPTARAVNAYDAQARLPLITAPTLIIESGGPLEVPHMQRASEVQQLIRGSRVATIENGDVFVVHSRAASYAQVLREFFDAI